MRNIIVLAGGSQSSKDLNNNGNEGAVLLVMDPYDGKVLKAFDGASFTGGIPRVGNASAGATPYMGMMIAEPTMYRSNISDLGRYLTGQLFAADNRGNMFRVSFENGTNASDVTPLDVSNWKIETVASLQTSVTGTSASFANPHGLVLDRVGSSIWVAGGTADLQLTRATEGDSGWLENNGGTGPQLIYAFKTDPDVSLPLLRTSSHKWVAVNKSDAGGAPSGSNGWYINLDTPQGKSREYMTTKPVIVNGVLFVSTFIEEQVETAADFAKCIPASIVTRGNSRLYALKLENGAAAGVWGSGQKYVTLENLKITGLTLTNIEKNNDRDKVALLISFDPNGPLPGFDAPGMFSARANGKIEMAGMWVSKPVGGKKDRFNPGETVISYWLESWGL
jgi:hypothetical protein